MTRLIGNKKHLVTEDTEDHRKHRRATWEQPSYSFYFSVSSVPFCVLCDQLLSPSR